MISAFFLLSASQVTPKVSLNLPATRLEVAAPALSTVLGAPVVVSNSAKDLLLFLNVQNVDSDALRKQIEKALYVQIVPENGQWVISRTEQDSKQIETDSLAYRVESATSLLRPFVRRAKDLKPFTPADRAKIARDFENAARLYDASASDEQGGSNGYDQANTLIDRASKLLPSSRFLARLLAQFSANDLATVKLGRRKAFASNPTTMQSPLNVDTAKLLQQLESEQAAWAGYKVPKSLNLPPEIVAKTQPFQERPVNIVIDVTRQEYGTNIILTVFGRSGRELLQEFAFDELDTNDPVPEMLASERDNGLKLSKTSKAIMDVMSFGEVNRRELPQLKTIARTALADPLAKDWLAFGPSESLSTLARQRGWNIVANFSDAFGVYYTPTAWKELLDLSKYPTISVGPKLVTDQGFVRLSVREPEFGLMNDVSRSTLRSITSTGSSGRTLGLQDVSTLLNRQWGSGAPLSLLAIESYWRVFSPSEIQSFSGDAQSIMLFGQLSPAERSRAVQGIPLSALSGAVRKRLESMVFFDANSPFNQPEQDGPGEDENGDVTEMSAEEKLMLFFAQHPTLAMPNGLPSNGILRVVIEPIDVVKCEEENAAGNSTSMPSTYTAEDFAYAVYASNRPSEGVNPDGVFKLKTTGLQMFRRTNIVIQLDLGRGVTFQTYLAEEFAQGPANLTLSTLPAAFKKQYDQAYARAKADGG